MKNIKKKSVKWWVGAVSCMILFIAIGSFAYLKTDFLFNGVQIRATIDHTNNSPLVQVRGRANHAVYISINGREIYIDKDGTFTEPIALLPGLSVVTINAQDKFGKTSEKKMELMYQESNGAFAYNETKAISN